MTWRLITIRPSHYCEKARWALDYFSLPYVERPQLPMLHFPAVVAALLPRQAGRADPQSTRFSTPALITGARALTDSSEILAFANVQANDRERDLFWTPEAAELERHFSGRFGADVRVAVYHTLLPHTDLLIELARRSVGPVQAGVFIASLPAIRVGLRERLGVREDRAQRAWSRITAMFDEVDARLDDGRPFLCGDRFSAADLSFAALASLALGVGHSDGYGAWIPELDALGGELEARARQLRARPSGAFVLRMFAEHRGRRALPCRVGQHETR
ncbi:glutathione S-transferase N-terminal domain-containing protein [Pseudenhygromyxa sp. WMMC2535]|uniref:glutathione S-transferase C-terminal domain-containing protein n=1 Tax=Pseudenhygromyxa sp. WMMC2535 TaxID=2712867 RepID=UPI0015534E81|nr:glutathione S-transferase C-terminal domain-containing protein [Pseudenhygromyxa sp. WMMC2535]NVB42477.1 glutathione S-transferase N-terminal domain-containing protein [Pseudenhygromyxa sp. WMMC2535]